MGARQQNSLIRFFIDNRRHAAWVVLFLLTSLCAGIFQTEISRLYGRMVDYGVAWQLPEMLSLALPIAVLLLLDFGRVSVSNIINATGTERIFFDMRARMYRVLLHAETGALDRQMRSGDIVTRINKDLTELGDLVADTFTWHTRVVIMAAVALVNCVLLSWQLSVIYLALLPISIAVTRRISAPIERRQKEQSAQVGKAVNVATDLLHGLMMSKSFGLERTMSERFARQSDAAVESTKQINRIILWLSAARYAFGVLPVVATMLLGLSLVVSGTATVGTVIAFVAVSAHIRTALDLMGNISYALRTGNAKAARVYEVLDLPLEPEGTALLPDADAPPVAMKDVAFGYEDAEILSGLSLSVRRGERIGLVGPSGCGKSTIIRLICRIYAHRRGELLLFGHPIEKWSPDALRGQISVVTQDPNLFDGTIYENVAYGRDGAAREEVLAALEAAHLAEFIATLPDGVDTRVGESGAKLSGGQKQRVAIARALLKDAPLVLLDEATSALDAASEAEVQRALDRLLEGRTAIIVAHRLTTLKDADRILFLENGRVAEQGTRAELLAAKGRYYEMERSGSGVARDG